MPGHGGCDSARAAARSPSTRAPPPARSSAAWSAGRASWRRGCPRCDPAATRCCARRPRSPTAPGHAWEQVVLPAARARGRRALLCPANLAPLAFPRTVRRRSTTPRALRHPGWYSRAYAAWQRRLLPVIARRARRIITVSEFSRARAGRRCSASTRARSSVVTGGVDGRFTPAADAGAGARRAGARAPRTCCAWPRHTARKNLAALVAGRPRARRATVSKWSWPAGTARSSPRSRAWRAAAARPRRRRAAPRPLRRRGGVRAARRATRASGCRCSRRWRAGRRWSPPPPARCPRPAAAPPGSSSPSPRRSRDALVAPARRRRRARAAARRRPRPRARPHLGATARRGRRAAAGRRLAAARRVARRLGAALQPPGGGRNAASAGR